MYPLLLLLRPSIRHNMILTQHAKPVLAPRRARARNPIITYFIIGISDTL